VICAPANVAPFRILNRVRSGSLSIAAIAWLVFQTVPLHAAINVVSYWRMGESDPGAAAGVAVANTIDSAGTNNLTVQGAALYASDVAATATYHTGSSLSVNFANGAFATNAIVSTATYNFGIECWVKPTALGTNDQVIAYNGSTGGFGSGGWGIFIAADHTYEGLLGGAAAFGTNVAIANVWTHLALVRSGAVSTLYVNGVAAASNMSVPGVPATGAFGLAAPPQTPTNQFFTGLIDEVRVFTFAAGQFSTNDLLVNQPFYLLGTTSLLEGPTAGIDSVLLAVRPETSAWAATTNAAWLHLSPANQSGTGSTNVVFTFDANAGATRTGSVTIAGQTVTVTQAGAAYIASPTPTILSSGWGLHRPEGLAVDGSGILWIAATGDDEIAEWIPAIDTLGTPGLGYYALNQPSGVALDSAGNIYIADTQNHDVAEMIAANSSVRYLVTVGLAYPTGVAVDRSGDVYIADEGNRTILKWSAANGSVATLNSGSFSRPWAVAVDVAGNLFIADNGAGSVWEANAATGSQTPLVSSGLNQPSALAVDGCGNVYIADTYNFAIKKWVAANNEVVTLASGVGYPMGVAVDAQGNVYFSDSYNNFIEEQPYVFVDPTSRMESANAGTDVLSSVLPATANLAGPFTPTSDQSWLIVGPITNGVVSFSFTANNGASRTAHITLFGVSIAITQAGGPPILTGATLLSNGVFQFSFTNNSAASSFTVISTTNVSLPRSQWTVIGPPANVAPGLFQFTSAPLTNEPQRFYSVRSP